MVVVSLSIGIELEGAGKAYVEELNVVKDVVVKGKVVAGDDIDASILLDLPVSKAEPLTLGEQVLLGKLAAPVSLIGLLEVT